MSKNDIEAGQWYWVRLLSVHNDPQVVYINKQFVALAVGSREGFSLHKDVKEVLSGPLSITVGVA